MDLSKLRFVPEPIILLQPNGSEKEYIMRPLDVAGWQLLKQSQEPANQDNMDITYKLFQRLIPGIEREVFDCLSIPELSLILVNATGAMQEVMAELGKDAPQTKEAV